MVLADQKTCPPSLCSFITLITYLFSLLPFTCLACLCASLCLCTLALTPYPTRCVGLSTYVIKSFLLFHSTVAPIIFILVCSKYFSPKFFYSSPPGSCHPLFTFPYPFHLPDFLQPACFSACLLFVLPLLSVVVRVSWTDAVYERSFALLTHGQHHTRTGNQARVRSIPFSPTRPRKPENVLSFSPLTPPLSPLWSRP